MSLNGVWKIEMLGPDGWECVSAAFFEDGTYRSASADHYSTGRYEVTENHVKISARAIQFGDTRTVFGKKEKNLDLVLEGDIVGDRISGRATDNSKASSISVRITRLADLS